MKTEHCIDWDNMTAAQIEAHHEAVCKERDQLRKDFDALNEVLRTTCTELDETKSFKRDMVAHCEKVEAELIALRKENAELVEAMQHPSYAEENKLRAELDALKAQGSVAWADVPDATAWLEDLRGKTPTPLSVPDGFVLMPITPTPEICAVIRNEHDIYGSAEELYAALFDAAPKPGDAP